jgi:hypothetical protein
MFAINNTDSASRRKVPWLSLALTLIVLGSFCTIIGQRLSNSPIRGRVKLLTISSDREEAAFQPPVARVYMLVAKIPVEFSTASTENAAIIRLESGDKTVLELKLEGRFLTMASWEQGDPGDVYSYSVTGPQMSNAWDFTKYLSPTNSYKISVERGPVGGSIWLHHIGPSGWDLPFGSRK